MLWWIQNVFYAERYFTIDIIYLKHCDYKGLCLLCLDLFIVFRFEMTWSAIRSIQISKHSFVRTTQDESYCTSYSVEQSIFNLAYKCFAGMKDRATLRSDLSAVSGLRGVICESLLFFVQRYELWLLPGNQSDKSRGTAGGGPPELLSGVTRGSGYMPAVMNS